MRDHASAVIVLIPSLLFCSWNLYTGIRERKTWTWLGVYPQDTDKRTSPWNYRAMLLVWAAGAALSLFALIYIMVKGVS